MTSDAPKEPLHEGESRHRPIPMIPVAIAASAVGAVLLAGALAWHAAAETNKVALASLPKPVTVLPVMEKPFRIVHTYVGALRPWVEAHVGPQFVSAYVKTVLVRPGAVVRENEVLATLDCRYTRQQLAAMAAQAKAVAKRQRATADQAARTRSLLDGGFVSQNDSELLTASSESEAAELEARRAILSKTALDVSDCVLVAPFDGEVSLRLVDPGSFVRPGSEMLGVVDRRTVRMTADAPESDFDTVAPGTGVTVHVVATGLDIPATITRRAPSADPATRTIHFEIDIADATRRIPVDTTGELHVPVGVPVAGVAVPIRAVKIDDRKATFFTVEGGTAHARVLAELGEVGPEVFFLPGDLKPGTLVVLEGRALLDDGDLVTATPWAPAPDGGASTITGPSGARK